MQRDTDISSLVISAYQFTGIAFIFPMSQIDSGGKCWSLFLLKLAGRTLNIGQDTHPFLRDFLSIKLLVTNLDLIHDLHPGSDIIRD